MSEAIAQPSIAKAPLEKVWGEIREHGIEKHIAELDAYGYTIIPPQLASPNGLADRLLEAVLEVAERRNGIRPDLKTGSTHVGYKGRFAAFTGADGDSPIGLLFEGQIF